MPRFAPIQQQEPPGARLGLGLGLGGWLVAAPMLLHMPRTSTQIRGVRSQVQRRRAVVQTTRGNNSRAEEKPPELLYFLLATALHARCSRAARLFSFFGECVRTYSTHLRVSAKILNDPTMLARYITSISSAPKTTVATHGVSVTGSPVWWR